MTNAKAREMVKQLALYRLASRELEGIIASCEMFFSHAVHDGEGEHMRALSNEFSKFQQRADRLKARLDRDLAAFESIEVKEIY